MGTTAVDLAAVRAVAQRIESAAETLLEAPGAQPGSWHIDGANTGCAHSAAGAALRRETERLTTDLVGWGYAAGELAAALRSGADGRTVAESEAAAVLR